MELDLTLLDTKDRLRRDDLWMRTRIRDAGASAGRKGCFVARIDTRGYNREAETDDTYKHFYGTRFPPVYRVEDLYWCRFTGPKPRAVVLVCSLFDDVQARVMFRLDKHGVVCAHAYGIAVTEAMMGFAKQQLPKLEKQARCSGSARKAKRQTRRAA